MVKYLIMKTCRRSLKFLTIAVVFLGTGIGAYLVWPRDSVESKDRTAENEPERRRSWARAMSRPGLPNLYKVNNGLYRGGQPEKEGYKELVKLGVKTIVCIRTHDDDSKNLGDLPIQCVHLSVTLIPTKEQVAEFLKVATDKKRQPVYFHCMRGADRTGTMCVMYRIAVDGWSKEAAIEEMAKGGFGLNPLLKGSITKFVQKMDVDWLREKSGLKGKAKSDEKSASEPLRK
jgi:protein tyrosine phosphatase (PTP) superfamily phosphohydrolase (DUF442 family)